MKLLYCEVCSDIIAPYPQNNIPRWCRCKRHAVWWLDGVKGILRLYDGIEGPDNLAEGVKWYPKYPRAYVIGITNALLRFPDRGLGPEAVQLIIDAHDDYYIFKRWHSMIIRIRPGESSDTAWAALPSEKNKPEDAVKDLTKIIFLASALAAERSEANDLSEKERLLFAAVTDLEKNLESEQP